VVAEALAAGVPVLTTEGTPWRELEERDCGWWIDLTLDSLASALDTALSRSPETRAEMGRRGRELIEEKYTWPSVATEMVEAYSWMIHGGERPSFINVV